MFNQNYYFNDTKKHNWLLVYVRGNQTNNNTLSEETNAHTLRNSRKQVLF